MHETKAVQFPQDMSCEKCIVQLVWTTPAGEYYSCADVTLKNEKLTNCMGKCQNGGACANGACVCYESYSGEFCQDTCKLFF